MCVCVAVSREGTNPSLTRTHTCSLRDLYREEEAFRNPDPHESLHGMQRTLGKILKKHPVPKSVESGIFEGVVDHTSESLGEDLLKLR